MSLFVHESLAGKLEMILLKATDTVGIMGENWIFDLVTGNPFFLFVYRHFGYLKMAHLALKLIRSETAFIGLLLTLNMAPCPIVQLDKSLFIATVVALHFTPVSESVSQSVGRNFELA